VAQSTGGCATAKPRGHCRAQPDFGTARNGGIDGGRVGDLVNPGRTYRGGCAWRPESTRGSASFPDRRKSPPTDAGETRQGNTLRHTGADVCSRYGIGALDSNKARMVHALHSLTYFRGPSDVS
jgi:hypothetical protein